MARTKGARDKKVRKRRKSTAKEKQEREKKREKQQEKRQKKQVEGIEKIDSYFVSHQTAAEAAPPDPAPTWQESEAPPEPDMAEPDMTPEPEEPEPNPELQKYMKINAHECNGLADLGEIGAAFDDKYDEGLDSTEDGTRVMKTYMQALMKRFETEASPDFVKNHPKDSTWLHEWLKDHGYWIRSECAHTLCRKLGIEKHEESYYRDIRVWFPDIEGGQNCMPSCVTCERNDQVQPHSYPMDHPGRRVVTFETDFFIMS